MWQGQQPPGGEQNPQDPNQNPYQQPGYPQQPNPYAQPGYPQPGPPPPGAAPQPGTPPAGQYQQPVQPWNMPTASLGAPGPPPDNRKKTTITAVVAAAAVVIAAGVTGFLVLGDGDEGKDEAKAPKDPMSAAPKTPTDEPPTQEGRGNGPDVEAVIPGWQVVVNPKRGTAFDVPPGWVVNNPERQTTYIDEKTEKPVTSMTGVAEYKPDWCAYDDDKNGEKSTWKLAGAGTKGANGAKDTGEAAQNTVGWWIYGPYTQPSQKNIGLSKPSKYKSKVTGLEGSIAYAESQGVPKSENPCSSEGKALSFGFKNKANDFVVWSLYGPKDVKGELDEATIKKILSSVRLAGMPQG